jgi:hypothetical protein
MDWTAQGSVVGWQLIRKYIWCQDFPKQQRHSLRNRYRPDLWSNSVAVF